MKTKCAKQPLVSVIVPVYKVEAYLQTCVDSILEQPYENIEIILVDDGSPDRCPMICEEYAKKDPRIRVIHQENRGLPGARNTGLRAASGEWIICVDSDDLWKSDLLESVMAVASDAVDQLYAVSGRTAAAAAQPASHGDLPHRQTGTAERAAARSAG
jgi:glycosyltransferase involved in cell wall biosynthesis